jgi:trigger factor
MQATQVLAEGLKREYQVVLAAADLEQRLTAELDQIKDRVRINGFRPGKVPAGHLRRLYGRSVMADVLQNAVNEANRKIVEENDLKLAFEPQVTFPQDKDTIEAVMEGKGDLAFTVALEVLPKVELKDLSGIVLEKEVASVEESDLDAAVERMAGQNRAFEAKGDDATAAQGDRVSVDFVGRIDGTPFEGGTGEGIQVEIGSGSFIPGFEDQLVGMTVGETRLVKVQFPVNYMAEKLAGKDAEFDVTLKAVEAPLPLKIDDEMAKGFGMADLAALRNAVKEQIERDFGQQSRRKLKKVLLDALDKQYDFDLPPTLVEQEFVGIWSALENDMKTRGASFADEGKTEDEAKAEYRRIAQRRVRLGLVLAQAGEGAKVQVSDDEVTQALIERARQFPGQEKAVWDYYRKTPQALAELRAPIFEDKVVDHLLGQVTVNDKPVTKEALFADGEEEAGEAKAESDTDEKPKAKKAKAKKSSDDASEQ